MRPSRFNIFIDIENGNKLAFNSSTAALAKIDAETYPVIQKVLSDPGNVDTPEEQELRDQLAEGKFLVAEETDETAELKEQNRLRRFTNPTLFLTIAPTLACNFACDYCFESRQAETINEETQRTLLNFSESYLKKSEGLVVTWFGGEPTLCCTIIENLQRELQDLAAKYSVESHPCSIITNGYLLDGALAQRLHAAGVSEAQVTLDGPQQVHDARRKLRNGRGTYQRITTNLVESSEILKIVVRVNIDKDNFALADDVCADLEKHGVLSRVHIYFAPVNSSENICADMKNRCFTTEEFAAGQLKLYQGLVARGFTRIEYPMLAPGGYCGADCANSFVVSPRGDLFKCWEETSTSAAESVGTVFSAELQPSQKANLDRYLSWDPFAKTQCIDCNILPICMGGCPHQGMKMDSADRGSCSSWKYNLPEMLRLRYLCDR